jgi:transcription termination factor NusB
MVVKDRMNDFKNCSAEEQRYIASNPEFIHRVSCVLEEQDRLNATIRALLRDMRTTQELNNIDDGPIRTYSKKPRAPKPRVSRTGKINLLGSLL